MKKLIIILLFSPFLAKATVRYVIATGGASTGSALTIGTAWNITYALTASVSGDTLHPIAGTYTSTVKWTLKAGVSMDGDGKIGALGGTKVIVNFSSYTSINDAFLDLSSTTEGTNGNQSISNIEFDGNAYTGEQCIMIKCRSNVVVHDIYVHNFNRCAVFFKGTNANTGAPGIFATGNLMYNDSLLDCSDRKGETTTSAGNITIAGQSGMIIRNNYNANLNKPAGHNGNLFSSIQGHNKGLLIHDNIWSKPQNELLYAPSFCIESWREDGGYEIYNNTFTGAANQIDAGTGGCVKGAYAYSWYVHDNVFQMASQITYQPISIYNMGLQWEDDCSDVIVSNNTFKNLQEGIRLNQSHTSTDMDRNFQIHNNLFINTGMNLAGGYGNYAIVLNVVKTGTVIRDIFIYNNTITGSAANTLRAGVYMKADSGSIRNVRIINNIIRDATVSEGWLTVTGKAGSTIDSVYAQNNVVYNNAFSNLVHNIGAEAFTHLFNTGNIITDPLLTSTNLLSAISPAINVGLNVGFGLDGGAFPYGTGVFTFTIPSGATRYSVGVYKTDSTLVRSLITDSAIAPGTYTRYWDGKDDNGNTILSPDPTYVLKVLSSNVVYNWDGVIGNTSTNKTGSTVHRGTYTSMIGMAITGTTAYFCQGYSEGYPSEAKFSTTNPQVRLNVYTGTTATMNSEFVVTDGTNVYWAGYDAVAQPTSFVHATAVSNDADVSFGINGSSYAVTYGRTYPSVIDKVTTNAHATGLAVSSSYLFVSHGKANQLHVLDKTTGALLQNIAVTNPQGVAVEGSSLWMISNNTIIAKYTVNAGGTLSAATVTLAFTSHIPGAIAVNAGLVSVVDSTNQTVRFFSTTTGTEVTVLGVAGGYATSPIVTNTKFMFKNYYESGHSYIAYAPDGSFWLGDGGNYRNLHFSASGLFIETIMSMGATYSIEADLNDNTRVFGNYLEFAIDYTQLLTGSTGWSLAKNWGYTGAGINGTNYKIVNIATLSNGRTYCFNYYQGFGELTSTGFRFIGGVNAPGGYAGNGIVLCKDGSKQIRTGSEDSGANIVITKYPLTGFDVSNNPIWSSTGTRLVKILNQTYNDPTATPVTDVSTATNKVIFYTTTKQFLGNNKHPQKGYHLGAIKIGDSTWRWKTMNATYSAYQGLFPRPDRFDIGNGVNDYAGSQVRMIDSNLVAGYHGEFWKNGQTNYYNHFLSDGLAVGQFGRDGANSSPYSDSGNAGNALTIALVRQSSTTAYLYHGDESQHSGVHRWSLNNLNTIAESYRTISYPSNYVAPVIYGYIDLHAGLPFNSTLGTQVGWSQTGTTIAYYSNRKKYINDGSPDILEADVPPYVTVSGTASVQRDLGTNTALGSWNVITNINFNGTLSIGNGNKVYIEVLDASSKILGRFNWVSGYAPYPTPFFNLYGNSVLITNNVITGPNNVLSPQSLEIKCVAGTMIFTYANYASISTPLFDVTADWRTPKTFRVYTIFGSPSSGAQVGLVGSRFYIDNDTTTPISSGGQGIIIRGVKLKF